MYFLTGLGWQLAIDRRCLPWGQWPEGGGPYLDVRFGYDLGTVFSVLGSYLGTVWVYLGTVWVVLGCGLGRTWVRLGSYLGAAWLGRTSLGCGLNTAAFS